jgi:CRISPR-associated protein Cas5h
MKAVSFTVKGTIAHFRRPDTTATQLTYPFITPTAAKGLVGAILGITDFVTHDKVAIALLHPVRTTAQQLSMLGKDNGRTFNRPTTIELLVNPAYRIYYVGDEHVDELAKRLLHREAVYPTYLGSGYALTFPLFGAFYESVQPLPQQVDQVQTRTVIPVHFVKQLIFAENEYLSRANGFMQNYLGQRNFEKSLSFLYERTGCEITFIPDDAVWEAKGVVRAGDEYLCLT